MSAQTTSNDSLLISYLTLRKAIGILGISLPFVLALGLMLLKQEGIQPSISDYYYTVMGDVFVGMLCSIGVFLMSYRGYDRKDDLAGDLACLFAVGVALFPTTPDTDPTQIQKLIGLLHYTCAGLLFLTFAFFSLKLFRMTSSTRAMTLQKNTRNKVYQTCGIIILVSLVLVPVSAWLLPASINPVFWFESVMIIAFGVSWLVKGEAILSDQP